MPRFARMTAGGGSVAQVYDGRRDIVIGQVRHPASILERWSAEELAALRIVPVVEDPRPAIDETAQALEPVPAKKGDAQPRDRWRVVDLTPDELAARKAGRVRATDTHMAAVVPALVDALVDKGVMALADLAPAARTALAERKALVDG